jgi:Xaa-Pro dipeptidase
LPPSFTHTLPGRKFSPQQRAIYTAVLDAKDAVVASMRLDTSWVTMHELAERMIAAHLLDMRLLSGDIEAVIAAGIPLVFMPHGLGTT